MDWFLLIIIYWPTPSLEEGFKRRDNWGVAGFHTTLEAWEGGNYEAITALENLQDDLVSKKFLLNVNQIKLVSWHRRGSAAKVDGEGGREGWGGVGG